MLEITGYGRMGACGSIQHGEKLSGSTIPARAVTAIRSGDRDALKSLLSRSRKLRIVPCGANGRDGLALCYGGALLVKQLPENAQWTPEETAQFSLAGL